jgi:tRNA(adenine34) deaminase
LRSILLICFPYGTNIVILAQEKQHFKRMELDDEYFMKQALKLAQQALDEDEVPIGAILVWNKKIIAKGYNQSKMLNDCTAHAEMLALTSGFNAAGSPYLNDCTMYVTIEPCPMCAGALKWSQLGKLVYGASEPKSGFSIYNPSLLHPKTKITSSVLKEECAEIMSQFFRAKRNLEA